MLTQRHKKILMESVLLLVLLVIMATGFVVSGQSVDLSVAVSLNNSH